MSVSDRLKKAIQSKLESNDPIFYHYLTPSFDEFEAAQAIYEAREYGISIRAFGDTKDKVVITPKNLGFYYSYTPREGIWGDSDYNWDDLENANKEMFYLAQEIIKLGFKVWMVSDDMDGRGYIDTAILDVDDLGDKPYEESMKNSKRLNYLFNNYFFVLFVFTYDFEKDFKKYIE